MTLEIIGAGFGRTGTHSLKLALEILGFGPCYHMYEIVNNAAHVTQWEKIRMNGSVIKWTALLGEYRSAVDWPVCSYWKELASYYPDARLIITIREPEEWYEDVCATVFKAIEIGQNLKNTDKRARCRMSGKFIFEKTFSGRQYEKDFVISTYIRHREEIKNNLSRERLLVFDITEGWEPLCSFLKVPKPADEFPESNSREEFLRSMLKGAL